MKKIVTHLEEQYNGKTFSSLLRGLLVLFLTFQSFLALGQTYPVQIQPTVHFPSTFLSDYNDPSNVNIRVYLADITKTNYRVKLKVKLTSEKFSAVSQNGLELILQGGEVYFLNDMELEALFSVSDLLISTNVSTTSLNALPEGVYTMSFEAYDAIIPTVIVSNAGTDFTVFSVNRYDPPMLNSPANQQAFEVLTINQNIFFTWTPRHIVFSPKQQVKYRFRLIKVQPVDRNPYDAMNVTLPAVIDQDGLDFPVFVYTPADLPLEEGCVYAWQISAYEEVLSGSTILRSSARFKNEGMSEVFTFSIKENCQPITPFKAPKISKNLVALQWNYDPSHKEYELNYRPFGTSLPWTPVSTVDNIYELDNTVLEPGVTYEYTVKAKCKNWVEPAYGGTFMLAVPTCSAPQPVTVDNSQTDKTVLSWAPVTGATAYRFQYKNFSNPSASFTSIELTNAQTEYTLPKLTSAGYTIKVDAVCDAETAEGKPNDVAFDETGVAGPCPIPTPFQLVATRIKGDQAQLAWPVSTAHTGYSITYWHRDSVAIKRTLTSTEPKVLADYVKDDQLYYYQITFICGTKSTTTPPGMFRVEGAANGPVTDPTTANCFPPAVLQAEPRSTTSAIFEWSKVDGVDEYQLFYAVKGTNLFKPFNTISNSAQLKGLEDSEKYQYMVRSRCGGKYSIFSDTALVDLAGGRSNANCDSAAYFITKGQTKTDIRLCWPYKAGNTGYKLTFREAAQSPADEYTQTFSDIDDFKAQHLLNDTLRYTFDNLKPGTAYIFKLQVLCGTDEALRNAPLKVSTVAEPPTTGECGRTASCDKTIVTPLTSLAPGDSIHCADYGILVDKITASNPATGTYTGSGFMNMPFPGLSDFVRMSVSFKNVKINAKPNSCIYDGTINIDSVNASVLPLELRDKIKEAEEQITSTIEQAQNAITAAQNGIDQAQEALQTAVDYFQGGDNVGSVRDGGLGEETTTQTITLPMKAPVSNGNATLGGQTLAVPGLIKDGTGSVFQVGPDGTVTHVGKYDPALAVDTTLDIADGKMVYAENSSAKYDYDEWKSQYSGKIQVEREYEKIGTSYYVPAKLIVPGELDKVNALLVGGNYNKNKIKFANGKGMVYDHTLSGNTFTLNIAGGPAADGQHVYAWFVDGTTKKAIGKLLVPSYAPQQKEVVIIPVGKSVIDAAKYQKGLNDVYAKIGITYTVTVDQSFKDNKSWDLNDDGKVQASGSKLLSTEYKGEEAEMIKAYVASKGGEDKLNSATAYILAVYEAANLEDNLLGKMPAQEQFGFLYVGGAQESSLIRTVAHEIGHGAYHMEHSFHNIYLGPDSKTKTTNIMDYSTGLDLWKFQWDIVHDPGHVWGILKKDKDAQNISVFNYNFLDPSGRVFSLKNSAYPKGEDIKVAMAVEYGPVLAFEYNNGGGQLFTARYNDAGDFIGYKSEDNLSYTQEYVDPLSNYSIHVLVKSQDNAGQLLYKWKAINALKYEDPLSEYTKLVCIRCSSDPDNPSPQIGAFSSSKTIYKTPQQVFLWDYKSIDAGKFVNYSTAGFVSTDLGNVKYEAFTFADISVNLIKCESDKYDFSNYKYPSTRSVSSSVKSETKEQVKLFEANNKAKKSNVCIVTKDKEVVEYNHTTDSYTSRTLTPLDRLPNQAQLDKNHGILIVQQEDNSYNIQASNTIKKNLAVKYIGSENQTALQKIGNFFVAYGRGLKFAGNEYHKAWTELAELVEDATQKYVTVTLTDYKCPTIEQYKKDHYTQYWSFVMMSSNSPANSNYNFAPSGDANNENNRASANGMGVWNAITEIPNDLVGGVAIVSSVFSSEQWSKGADYIMKMESPDDPVKSIADWTVQFTKKSIEWITSLDQCEASYYQGYGVGLVASAIVAPEGLLDKIVAMGLKAAVKMTKLTCKIINNVLVFTVKNTNKIIFKMSSNMIELTWKGRLLKISDPALIDDFAAAIDKGEIDLNSLDELTTTNPSLREKLDNMATKLGGVIDELKTRFGFSDASATSIADEAASLVDETAPNISNRCDLACSLGKIGCFVSGTPVLTHAGRKEVYKPIQTVAVNDYVSSYNHTTNKREYKLVTKVFNKAVTALVVLALSNGQQIEATQNHPFYVKNQYVEAVSVKVGDTLFTADHKIITVKSRLLKDTLVDVYNFTVADNDNYFVGDKNPVLVHNDPSCWAKLMEVKFPNLFNHYGTLGADYGKRFYNDFKDATDAVLGKLNANIKLVDAWKLASDKGVFLKQYMSVPVVKTSKSGVEKVMYTIPSDPKKVMLKLEQDPDKMTMLLQEMEYLNIAEAQGIPVAKVHGVTINDGYSAMVMDLYGDILKFSEPIPVQFLTPNSIKDLMFVKNKMLAEGFAISDIQFLIAKDGRVFLSDPGRVVLNDFDYARYVAGEVDNLLAESIDALLAKKLKPGRYSKIELLKNLDNHVDEVSFDRIMSKFDDPRFGTAKVTRLPDGSYKIQ